MLLHSIGATNVPQHLQFVQFRIQRLLFYIIANRLLKCHNGISNAFFDVFDGKNCVLTFDQWNLLCEFYSFFSFLSDQWHVTNGIFWLYRKFADSHLESTSIFDVTTLGGLVSISGEISDCHVEPFSISVILLIVWLETENGYTNHKLHNEDNVYSNGNGKSLSKIHSNWMSTNAFLVTNELITTKSFLPNAELSANKHDDITMLIQCWLFGTCFTATNHETLLKGSSCVQT